MLAEAAATAELAASHPAPVIVVSNEVGLGIVPANPDARRYRDRLGAVNRLFAARASVVLDGFIVGAAALVAARLRPEAVGFMVAAHRSPEPGHALALEALGLDPLLDLELRLGEGTGAVLALPLLRAARAILVEMATFAAAGVTDAGR